MKILYKQPNEDRQSSLRCFDVQNCYLKLLTLDCDHGSITKKLHHHTGFELHFVTEGIQEYYIDGMSYKLEKGFFLFISPEVPHTVVYSMPDTKKISITFDKQIKARCSCLFGKTTGRIESNLEFIINEAVLKKEISSSLIENAILEILVQAFRMSGVEESKGRQKQDEDTVVSIGKQYINDNIEINPTVSDVAQYCYLSTKQLTRLFLKFEGTSPGRYIIKSRVAKIEKLLSEPSLSLKRISEIMNFNSEYYLNAFFKKYAGMPPGEYRKTLGQ